VVGHSFMMFGLTSALGFLAIVKLLPFG